MNLDFSNISVGCDIEHISRFEGKIDDEKFLQKLYTQVEIKYCKGKSNPARHLAARYCAKEAVIKSLTAFGMNGIFYKDIEVKNELSGMPTINILHDNAKNIQVKISMSHSEDTAFATVLSMKI